MKTKILISLAMIFMASSVYAKHVLIKDIDQYKKEKCSKVVNTARNATQMSANGIPMEDYLYVYLEKYPGYSNETMIFSRKIALEAYRGQKSGQGVLSKIYKSCYSGGKFMPAYLKMRIENYYKRITQNNIASQ